MLWLWLYIATMFLIALPVAWFSRNEVAAVVFAVWAIGQTTYLLGFPEPETQVLIYAAAFVGACRIAKSSVCFFAAVLFFPLGLASLSHAAGWIEPAAAWWSIYWLAVTQVFSLPFCADWRAVRARWVASRDRGNNIMMRVRHA